MVGALAGTALTVAGALLLYLAAPHQKIATRAWGSRAMLAGGVALPAGLVLLLTVMGPASAVFAWMTGAMFVWSVVPLAAAWWRGAPEGK